MWEVEVSMLDRCVWAVVLVVLGTVLSVPALAQPGTLKFDFGPGPVGEGMTRVAPEMVYSDAAGFGFEPGGSITAVDRGGDNPVTGDFCTAKEPFFFSVAVPEEGNYRVTVTLGDRQAESVTTIKAELRRLMVERVRTVPGEFTKVAFVVNTRTPKIIAVGDIKAGEVWLKAAQEEGTAFIDLNAMSKRFYEAFGPQRSALAFAAPDGKQDNTHHNNYGS